MSGFNPLMITFTIFCGIIYNIRANCLSQVYRDDFQYKKI